jgi:NhaP-type Na+/H+ or K+/H+ antiporter
MPGASFELDGVLPTGVGLVVVLLLVGSTVAVLVRFLPVPHESVLALVGAIIGLTYGVVLTSILLQGITIGPVARRLLGSDLNEETAS